VIAALIGAQLGSGCGVAVMDIAADSYLIAVIPEGLRSRVTAPEWHRPPLSAERREMSHLHAARRSTGGLGKGVEGNGEVVIALA
jgi:hypothetical protein